MSTHLLIHSIQSFSPTDFQRIVKQFQVRKNKSLKQSIAFPFPTTNQFNAGYSAAVCSSANEYRHVPGSIPSMAQLYIAKALRDGTHSLIRVLTCSLTHFLKKYLMFL